MPQSLAKVIVHVVYSTKHRQPWLHDPILRSELYAYIATILFSVSPSNVDQVKRYIANQEKHHKRLSFQHEFREIYNRHGIGIDERYVWD